MVKIINDKNDRSIFGVDYNLYEMYDFFGSISGRTWYKGADVSWVNVKPYSYPNFIYNLQIKSENTEMRIKEICDEIRNKNAPPFLIVSPLTLPKNLGLLLEEQGMRPITQWPGIALHANNVVKPASIPDNFVVELVDDDENLAHWIRIASLELFKNVDLGFDLFKRANQDQRLKLFLGKLGDVPVATIMSFYAAGVAGAYMGTTLKEYRGIGIGKAIYYRLILEAEKDGYPISIGQSSIMGLPSWQKLGFVIQYYLDVYWMVGNEYK